MCVVIIMEKSIPDNSPATVSYFCENKMQYNIFPFPASRSRLLLIITRDNLNKNFHRKSSKPINRRRRGTAKTSKLNSCVRIVEVDGGAAKT